MDRDGVEKLVREAAGRHRLDPALVRAVIETESNWNPKAYSHKGAGGLMQLIPTTAQRYGAYDVFDPQQNIDAGVRYLRTLLERYHGNLDLVLAAYNAGEGAVDRAHGVPSFRETERRNALLFPETAARAVKAARMFKEIQRSVCGSSRMSPEKNRLFRIFAPFSLGFFLTTGVVAAPPWNAAEPTSSVKRQSASAQFARAEEQRAALNAKPSDKRSLADYKQVVMSYRRVKM